MKTLEEIGKSAKAAEPVLRIMGTNQKNEALLHVAEKLLEEKAFVLAENVKEAVKRVGERRKNERAKLRNYLLELDTDVSMEQADGTYFRIVRIHFDREGCGNGFLPMFEKELKAAFLQHDISMTATLLDPFCLILLLGSEEEKRWKKIEPILLSALNKFTSDGTLG